MGENEPQLWCLLGKKAGDNRQIKALADALEWPCEDKHIVAQPWELATNLGLGVTLAGIDRANSSPLQPPWPDMVLTAGRRNEPVARWIRRQSGGLTRLVHIGRPWSPLLAWDLIVTTPQYFLPRWPNVRHNRLPLNNLSASQLETAAASWQGRIADLPSPRIALLVGGDSGKFVFTKAKASRLGRLANALANEAGGSILMTDSARTDVLAGDSLLAELTVPHHAHRWSRAQESEIENPYLAFLGLADAVIVTGESMSMLGEASVTGKPLYIFDMDDASEGVWHLPHSYRYKPITHRLAMRLAPRRMRRDVGNIQKALVQSDVARWLDEDTRLNVETLAHAGHGALCRQELWATAQAVKQLLKGR
ncbi:MAG: ELM1/GtrOC1 family putative glycosyltransferase [Pseudomonadota bacterium]